MASWWERADWRLRQPPFGDVRELAGSGEPTIDIHGVVDSRVAKHWYELRRCNNVLAMTGAHDVAYVAIDWTREPLAIDARGTLALVSGWGIALTHAFESVASVVKPAILGLFTAPIAVIDVEDEIWVGWVGPRASAVRVPPEVERQWPQADERALVHVIGQLLGAHIAEDARAWDTPFGQVIERCVAVDPARRFAKLAQLRAALLAAGARPAPRTRLSREAWKHVERGLGWLAAQQPELAADAFAIADSHAPEHAEIAACLAHARALVAAQVPAPPSAPRRARAGTWGAVAVAGRELERVRRFDDALAAYYDATVADADRDELDLAIARCCMQLGKYGHAQDHAGRVLERDAASPAALAMRAAALLGRKRAAEALGDADAWIAATPDDGRAHYTRGKALLSLARLADARDAFERACTLAPHLLEAQLLRREADRALGDVRAQVGTAQPMTLAIPERLGELRDTLIAGRLHDAIAALRGGAYVDDAIAQLLLGELLAHEGRTEEALDAFVGVAALGEEHAPAALVGEGHALLALGRAADALACFDRALAMRADHRDAHDGRARSLAALATEPAARPRP